MVRVGRGTGTGMRGQIDGFMVAVNGMMTMTLLRLLPPLMMPVMIGIVMLITVRIIKMQRCRWWRQPLLQQHYRQARIRFFLHQLQVKTHQLVTRIICKP